MHGISMVRALPSRGRTEAHGCTGVVGLLLFLERITESFRFCVCLRVLCDVVS